MIIINIFKKTLQGNQDTKPKSVVQKRLASTAQISLVLNYMEPAVWTILKHICLISLQKEGHLGELTVSCPALVALSAVVWLVAGDRGHTWASDKTKCSKLSCWQPGITWGTKSRRAGLGEIWFCSTWTWSFLKINWKKEKERNNC